jgi:hypothetical protein
LFSDPVAPAMNSLPALSNLPFVKPPSVKPPPVKPPSVKPPPVKPPSVKPPSVTLLSRDTAATNCPARGGLDGSGDDAPLVNSGGFVSIPFSAGVMPGIGAGSAFRQQP